MLSKRAKQGEHQSPKQKNKANQKGLKISPSLARSKVAHKMKFQALHQSQQREQPQSVENFHCRYTPKGNA